MTTAVEEMEATAGPEDNPADDVQPTKEEYETWEGEQTKPVELPPEPPADCSALQREHYEQILAKEREVYAIEGEYLELKERAALAKKEFEAADKELRRMIARGPDQQKKLPFDNPTYRMPKKIRTTKDFNDIKAGSEFDNVIVSTIDRTTVSVPISEFVSLNLNAGDYEVIEWYNDAPEPEATTESTAENDAWRSAPFTELGLTFKQNELFEAQGIKTIGQLEDLRARMANGDFSAQWPKGIGPAKVTEIEDRVIDWLDKNRDKFGEVIGEEASDPMPGVESVTFSSPGRDSVTITPREFANLMNEADVPAKANGKSKAKKRK